MRWALGALFFWLFTFCIYLFRLIVEPWPFRFFMCCRSGWKTIESCLRRQSAKRDQTRPHCRSKQGALYDSHPASETKALGIDLDALLIAVISTPDRFVYQRTACLLQMNAFGCHPGAACELFAPKRPRGAYTASEWKASKTNLTTPQRPPRNFSQQIYICLWIYSYNTEWEMFYTREIIAVRLELMGER